MSAELVCRVNRQTRATGGRTGAVVENIRAAAQAAAQKQQKRLQREERDAAEAEVRRVEELELLERADKELGKLTDEQFNDLWGKAKRYADEETGRELQHIVTDPQTDDRARLAMMRHLEKHGMHNQ